MMNIIKSCTKIIVLLVAIIIAVLIFNDNIENQEGSSEYNMLCRAQVFAPGPIGYAGMMPKEVEAYYKLFNKSNAKYLFRKLEKEATIEGKLYTLCALYYLDNKYYNSAINKYKLENKIVYVQYGCMLEEVNLSKLIKTDFLGGNDPSNLKKYVEDYYKRNTRTD